MLVNELMTIEVATIRPEATLEEAAARLASIHVSGLPVVDDDGRIIGVVSTSDIISAEVAMSDGARDIARMAQTAVSDIMSPRPYTIGPSADVREAARHLHYAGVHRVFVTTEDRLLGVLSASDIVRAVSIGAL